MSPQRYEAVNAHDEDDYDTPIIPTSRHQIPSSPPPSFRSRASSPTSRRLLNQDPLASAADQNLADTFDDGEASDAENDGDDRQRLIRADTSPPSEGTTDGSGVSQTTPAVERRVTEIPTFRQQAPSRGVNRPTNDGVFANLAAKPERGAAADEKPPTYEQAAADATPPYWETTIIAPGMSSDEVYVDGLPVGSVFSFVWNGMISMSFQLVGFLLTYLLHTTHAAKNGSRAGLGLTLVQYGFYMRGSSPEGGDDSNAGTYSGPPPDANSHNFDPSTVAGATGAAVATDGGLGGISSSDWISYILMIVGWFILIRAVSDFLRARRHEQLVLQSPTRGLPIPTVAEEETSETAA